MSFGGQTVTFKTITESGDPDELGVRDRVVTPVDVTGCRHRPLKSDETPEQLTNTGEQIWKTTAPPEAAALAARSTGILTVDGIDYRIQGGAMPYTDFSGRVVKVTIFSSSMSPAV